MKTLFNVKDYEEKAMEALAATHDVKWFRGLAEYANVYVFWNARVIHGTIG